jgi:hypothetical protein
MVGTAVVRMVVSRDSIKKATATNQSRRRLLRSAEGEGDEPLESESIALWIINIQS